MFFYLPSYERNLMNQLFTLLRFVTLVQQTHLELKFQMANFQLNMYKERYGKIGNITHNEKLTIAVLGKKLGKKLLFDIHNIVTPETIMKWYRDFIKHGKKHSGKGRGRPSAMKIIVELVISIALSNPDYGYGRITGQINNRGHQVKKSTVRKICKANGIDISPYRKKHSSWNSFIQSNLDVLFTTDFFTVDVIDAFHGFKVKTFYVLFYIHLSTRKIHFAGMTEHTSHFWMRRMAINATDYLDGFLKDAKYIIHDRDIHFMQSGFRDVLLNSNVKPITIARKAPDMNAYAERFVKSVKNECTNKLMFFSEESLRYALREYETHYNHERNHQGEGIDNKLIEPQIKLAKFGMPKCKKRLGGLLKFYYTEAA